MSTLRLQFPSGELNHLSEEVGDVLLSSPEALLRAQPPHLDSSLPPELARRIVEEMRALTIESPALRCRLSVEDATDSLALDLSVIVEVGAGSEFRLYTPDDSQHLIFALEVGREGKGRLDLNLRYAGLRTEDALTYARFMSALHGQSGTLYLTRLEPDEFKLELMKLPLALEEGKKEAEDLVRLLKAFEEISAATGVESVYPPEVSEEDLVNINYILKVIRSGWIAQSVTSFTTPLDSEGVRNVLELVAEEGPVVRAFAMTSEYEQRSLFGSRVDLGPSMRYIAAARLDSSVSEMGKWLAQGREGDSFAVRWVPEDEQLLHVFYSEWPKPSLEVLKRNIQAFEDEYAMDSEEFRKAWDTGEPKAREIEEGEVWLSFLDARESLKESN